MATYQAPLRDMQFVLYELLDVEGQLKELPAHAETNRELIDQVLEEGARFTSEVILPTNQTGDSEGCHLDTTTHEVTTPKGFKEAYKQYADGGWAALACDPAYGGQGLPVVVNSAFYEMLNACNQAWAMYPGLTHGAYECLHVHGTPEQQKTYLPKLVSGEWTGTMCLTEPQCGTDLGMLRTKATPQADGSYLLEGGKIFISAGEHDMVSNIIHLVLARLPDAPPGTKGITLFIVPKYLPDANGNPGERNKIFCGAIEHKMGIRGNSTAQLNLDGARGWMLGQPNKGLQAMFVMMNAARLGVGMQSLGLTEISYQGATRYAKDRLQSRSLSGPKARDKPADPIIVHPDVRRMLLTARAWAEGARALTYWVALLIDRELNHPDEDEKKAAADLVALLTPIVKAFITDNAWQATSDAMQVYGGHGFIAEWGMEQHVRDARINMIYEGTNTIQSLDLLGRKVLSDNGARLKKLGAEITRFVEDNGTSEALAEFISPLADLGDKATKLTMEIGMKAFQNQDEVGAAAVPYLRVVGHLVYSYLFARMAKIALDKKDSGDPFYTAKLATVRFYFARLYPETAMLIRQARSGVATLLALEADLF
jgi:alkylation response protein AidB-like acyl-CoA dehydrogenase